jgi:sugar phosphate isomerase/epimerase
VWVLSGLADEISPDFDAQCRLLSKLGLRYLEFRSAWDVNALDLVAEELCTAKTILASHGLGVSSISSPIGRILIDEDFGPHLEQMRYAADVARFFDASYIRISSFVIPEGADADGCRDEVLRRMRDLSRVAEESRVILLHENENDTYGDSPRRCLDLVESVGSPHLRLAWDAGDLAPVGAASSTESYAPLRPYLEYIQIKDALLMAGQVETLRSLRRDGFDGFFSLEPRLDKTCVRDGPTGNGLFTDAWRAFTDLLNTEDIPYV